jgi:hypothetical protein
VRSTYAISANPFYFNPSFSGLWLHTLLPDIMEPNTTNFGWCGTLMLGHPPNAQDSLGALAQMGHTLIGRMQHWQTHELL